MIIFNIASWLKVSGGRGERPKNHPQQQGGGKIRKQGGEESWQYWS